MKAVIYLYDDKLVLTFNYKDGTRTITLDDVKEAVKNNTGSDLDCLGAPTKNANLSTRQISVFSCPQGQKQRKYCKIKENPVIERSNRLPRGRIFCISG